MDKCHPWGVRHCRRHKRRVLGRDMSASSACCPMTLTNLESYERHSGNAGPDSLREICAGPGHPDQIPTPSTRQPGLHSLCEPCEPLVGAAGTPRTEQAGTCLAGAFYQDAARNIE